MRGHQAIARIKHNVVEVLNVTIAFPIPSDQITGKPTCSMKGTSVA